MVLHPHGGAEPPSPWITRFADLIEPGAQVLDLACGYGRHVRALSARGLRVEAVDRDGEALSTLAAVPGVSLRCADLESDPWPYPQRRFDAIVVANYLHRPLFGHIVAALREGGVLIYETFMVGNERFGRPSNPAFLLRPGELLERLAPDCAIVAFEQGEVARPRPAVVQRVCAARGGDPTRQSLP